MKQFTSKLLPASSGSKMVAIYGLVVAAIGILLTISYALGPSDSCIAMNQAELTRDSIIIGFAHFAVSFGLLLHVRSLNDHPSAAYKSAAIAIYTIILFIMLFFAMGYAFAVGTACTT